MVFNAYDFVGYKCAVVHGISRVKSVFRGHDHFTIDLISESAICARLSYFLEQNYYTFAETLETFYYTFTRKHSKS